MTAVMRNFGKFENVLGALAALALAAMMVTVSADTFMRYFFNSPIQGTQDLVGKYLMVAAYFGILSQSYATGAQIRIDFLLGALPARVQHIIEAIGCLATAIVFALVAWFAASKMSVSFTRSEVIPGAIPWPIWLTYALVTFGTGLLVLRLLVNGTAHLGAALGRTEGPQLPSLGAGH